VDVRPSADIVIIFAVKATLDCAITFNLSIQGLLYLM
jgi:hypothetical protein